MVSFSVDFLRESIPLLVSSSTKSFIFFTTAGLVAGNDDDGNDGVGASGDGAWLYEVADECEVLTVMGLTLFLLLFLFVLLQRLFLLKQALLISSSMDNSDNI